MSSLTANIKVGFEEPWDRSIKPKSVFDPRSLPRIMSFLPRSRASIGPLDHVLMKARSLGMLGCGNHVT